MTAFVVFLLAGASALLAAVLPRVLQGRAFSLPMAFLGLGVLIGFLPGLPRVDPVEHEAVTEHLTEVVVIISLMGAGLAIDRPVGWRRWRTTWRLLAVAMPLTIVLVAVTGSALGGLPLAAAVLLGSALAPTDPVLAGDVQVAEPSEDSDEDEVRFALTSEAGLNDGAAFPGVYLAVALAAHGGALGSWLWGWALGDLLLRLAVGVAVGIATGWVLGRVFFRSRVEALRLSEQVEGFTALAVTFLAYGAAQLLHGYGFVAVFVAAVTLRAAERSHGAHQVAHSFVEQTERMLTAWLLLLLGAAMSDGLLGGLTWRLALVAVLLVVVVRPLVGMVSTIGTDGGWRERAVIAFFGVRGIGSLYYLAYALGHGDFPGESLWAVVALAVATSVVVHGVLATPVVGRLDRRRSEHAHRTHGRAEGDPAVDVHL
ncbi:cation:proton antiporter [Quadrisphaera setariae]|uniref:Sodium:proton antiporter n=1 Tax=Quadrisphaera setariae TaxID=2593304 RepID=A0A5C8ZKT3_9ACTN|nr:cation:proton antiporter [Quadrisphaera setariae]TXR57566.1 sodium:proton antiporter [Quadrisphaera setariae]